MTFNDVAGVAVRPECVGLFAAVPRARLGRPDRDHS